MFINGIKFACSTCVKGHRSSKCNHTDRPIFEIRKKGRPITQCSYCRELRKTRQFHIKCPCTDKTKRISSSNENLAYSTLLNSVSNTTGQSFCNDCRQQPKKQPLLVDCMPTLSYSSGNVLMEQQKSSSTSIQCSCHELAAKLLKTANNMDTYEKFAAANTGSTEISALNIPQQQVSTSSWSSSLSKSSPINLANTLPSNLDTPNLRAQAVPSVSSELFFVRPTQFAGNTTRSIYDQQTMVTSTPTQRKTSLSRVLKSTTKTTMEHKKRRSTISTVPILPFQRHVSSSRSEGAAAQLKGFNSGEATSNKPDNGEGQLQSHTAPIDYFSPKVASFHPEEQQIHQAHQMVTDSKSDKQTSVSPDVIIESVVGVSPQQASHDLNLTSSSGSLQHLSFSNSVILPPSQDDNNDDVVMMHSRDKENRRIDMDQDSLMSDRNTSLSLLNNAMVSHSNQGTALLPNNSAFYHQQQDVIFDSVDMIRSATTGSSESSGSSMLSHQQSTFQQAEANSPTAIAPSSSSFENDQHKGESVMITITPLSSLIDTSASNLQLESNISAVGNSNANAIADSNSSTNVNNFTSSTVTRIVTCFNGSGCNCPGCFVHLNNTYGASANVQNALPSTQQSNLFLQQQQTLLQPYNYASSSSNASASSNYSSDEEDKHFC